MNFDATKYVFSDQVLDWHHGKWECINSLTALRTEQYKV